MLGGSSGSEGLLDPIDSDNTAWPGVLVTHGRDNLTLRILSTASTGEICEGPEIVPLVLNY